MLDECPQEFVGSVLKPSRSSRPSSDTIYQGTVTIPYVKGVSEKVRRIGSRFNVRIILKSKHTLRGTLTKTGPATKVQQKNQCVYNIPCGCGRCYIGKTSKPSEVNTKKQKCNLTQSLLEKSKLVQCAYEDSYKLCWKAAKVLQIERNITYKKHKESTNIFLTDHPVSQPSLEISPIWTPVITAEVKKKRYSVQCRLYVKTLFIYWCLIENLSV
jgi:hypothetical protein